MFFWKKRPKTAKNQGKLYKNALKICKSMQTSNIAAGKEPNQPPRCNFTTFSMAFIALMLEKYKDIRNRAKNTQIQSINGEVFENI